MSVPAAPASVVPVAAPAARIAPRRGYDAGADDTARRVLPMLAGERVVWLSSVCPDGRPHLVPTWFWWDGTALLFWSKPDAIKVRNLRADPRLMVAVGDASADFSVGLIEAVAELVAAPVPDAFFAKYGDALPAGGLDRDTYRGLYTQAVRVVPMRVLAWRGRGDRHGSGPASVVTPARGTAARPRVVARLAALLDRAAWRLRGAGSHGAPVAA